MAEDKDWDGLIWTESGWTWTKWYLSEKIGELNELTTAFWRKNVMNWINKKSSKEQKMHFVSLFLSRGMGSTTLFRLRYFPRLQSVKSQSQIKKTFPLLFFCSDRGREDCTFFVHLPTPYTSEAMAAATGGWFLPSSTTSENRSRQIEGNNANEGSQGSAVDPMPSYEDPGTPLEAEGEQNGKG